MTEPIALPAENNLQDIKVKVFRDGKSIELSLHELPETLRRTACAIIFASYEF